ncbi:MAG: hypothetical protein QG602_2702 [Verrucomicrobiota bacterium]|nr:hypothetical protein [Verrucomicrobiota bacterium]
MKTPRALLATLVLAAIQAAAQQAPLRPAGLEILHLTASGAFGRSENISRTSYQPARRDAETYELTLSSTHSRQLAGNLLLTGTAEISTMSVPQYGLTNRNLYGGRLTLQRKFGLGAQAPVLQFTAGTSFRDARNDGERGWTTEARLELAKRVLPQLRLAAQAGWLEHTARRDTFDLGQESYSAEIRWDLSDRWSLTGTAGRLTGDVVAGTSWSVWDNMLAGGLGQAVFDCYTSRPWMITNLYATRWVSYNIESEVDFWSVSLGYAVTDRTWLELRRSASFVVNTVGVTYPTGSWSLGLTRRF